MINIAVGLVRMKTVAILLGPAGVGLIGLYFGLMQTATSLASLGIGTVGTRQIAAAYADGSGEALERTRRALFWGTTMLAVIGAVLFWLCSGWIARVILADESRSSDVAWLSIGVALSVASGSQGALLTGLRRVGDLARISLASGLVSSVLSAPVLWIWQPQGLVVAVLVTPVVTFVLGHLYVTRLPSLAGRRFRLLEMAGEWRGMIVLGIAFMLSGLVATAGHLSVRVMVQQAMGTDALGQFQAAWTIGITYLGIVLGAMGVDYFPRLTSAIGTRAEAVRLVNEQTEVALLLCAPTLVVMLGCSPYVIRLLYTAEFEPAAAILRWQLLGDVLKVMSWPLGYAILAAGAGKAYFVAESWGISVFVLGVWICLPVLGVTATGVAYVLYYIAYLPLVWWLARRRIGFAWSLAVKVQVLATVAAAVSVCVAAQWSEPAGAAVGITLGTGLGAWALMQLASRTGIGGKLGLLAGIGKRMKRWLALIL